MSKIIQEEQCSVAYSILILENV